MGDHVACRDPDGVALKIITCTYHFSVLVVDSPKERIWELGTVYKKLKASFFA